MGPLDSLLDRAFEYRMWQHREEIREFTNWLIGFRNVHNVLEIGGLFGGTAVLWSGLCSGRVISIDLPDGRFGGKDHGLSFDRCMARNENLRSLCPYFTGVLGDSHQEETKAAVANLLNGEAIDLLFIDGDHTYLGVKQDYEMYRSFVSENGVIAFHDINDTPYHRAVGCVVSDFWKEVRDRIPGHKIEFNINADWGGIGAVVNTLRR